MALLHQHECVKILAVGPVLAFGLSPGQLCCHADDKSSFGMVIAAGNGQCTVLWSIPPRGTLDMMVIKMQDIKAKSRQLRTEWRTTDVDDLMKNPVIRTLIGFEPA